MRFRTGSETTVIFRGQLEATAFPTSSIPSSGCPVTRLTEAGSATNGYSWTMSTALKNSLGAAANPKGTLIVDWTPMYAENSAVANIIAPRQYPEDTLLYVYSNNRHYASDATNAASVDVGTITANTTYTFAVRWDRTANSGNGYLQVSEKHAGTWAYGVADRQNLDADGFTITGSTLYLSYGNEYPFWIKNIKFFDGWVKDANLDCPIDFGLFPIKKWDGQRVKGYEY